MDKHVSEVMNKRPGIKVPHTVANPLTMMIHTTYTDIAPTTVIVS